MRAIILGPNRKSFLPDCYKDTGGWVGFMDWLICSLLPVRASHLDPNEPVR